MGAHEISQYRAGVVNSERACGRALTIEYPACILHYQVPTHPHIIRYHDFDPVKLELLMEYAQEGSLAKQAGPHLHVDDLRRFIAQVG